MRDEIIKLHKEGLKISEIIVKLNTTYKHVKKAIDDYEQSKNN